MALKKPGNTLVNDQLFDYIPVRTLEVDLEQPLPAISTIAEKNYKCAICLVRLHAQPLGLVEINIEKDGLSPDEVASVIWDNLHIQINEHLQYDHLPPVAALNSSGLTSVNTPHCIEERESFLQTAPLVSIIVSTRDRPDSLAKCLPSLLALNYPCYEIIIVDNAPTTTATADFIQQAYSDEPRIIYVLEKRPGLSFARNRGIKEAKGEILAFTDDDVIVDPYWLVQLVKAFSSADKVACVTGLGLPFELETQAQAWFEEFGGFNKGFTRRDFDRTGCYDAHIPLYPFAAGRFGSGASMAFTAAFLSRINGFDLALGAGTRTGGGEDLAAFFKVITSGYRLVYEPASLMYHSHRREYIQLRKHLYYCGIGLMAYLTKVILDNPLLLFDLIVKVPYGLFFILSSRSPKNSNKSKYYPKELTTIERKGMLYGPFAYMRSRWEIRKFSRKTFALDDTCDLSTRDGGLSIRESLT
jgi:GT2 family glycosyltransferase